MTDPLALDTRSGLPDALRALLRDLPRSGWQSHPNFNGMVRFWLDRHLMFRRLLAALDSDVQAVLAGDMSPETHAPRLARYGGMLVNELHGHHQIEDAHYFPRLARLDARAERGFALLEADHDAMDGLLHDLTDAANATLQGGAPGQFADRLAAFGTLLHRHLEDEEDIVVPVILNSGFEG